LTSQPDPLTVIMSEMPPRQFQHNSRRHLALARKLEAIATRNARDFADCGVPVIDPWRAA